MKKYKVYCHTNKANGKRYVGITGKALSERWRNGEGYRNNDYFYRAIAKYGWNGFTHKILASFSREEDALKMEEELISEWNTCNPEYGYNILSGGNLNSEENIKILIGAKIRNGVIRKVVNIETGEVFLGATDASRKTGIDASQISGVCIHKKNAYTAGGYHWCFEDELSSFHLPNQQKREKEVVNLDTGERYAGLREAERKTGISRAAIARSCAGKVLTAGGYHWKYSGADQRVREKLPLGKKVRNLETDIEYPTVREAAQKTGININQIYRACKNTNKTAGKYHWAYVSESAYKYSQKKSPKHIETNKRRVKNVETGEIFSSLKSAADSVGVAYNNISAVCRGKAKTSGGYHWEFVE